MNDPLAALRPIHTPPEIGWWPPAPGWWIVLLLSLLFVFGLIRWYRRRAAQRAALRELKTLRQQGNATAASINQLLKRYALQCYSRQRIAALSGEDWLQFLAEHGGHKGFSRETGQWLIAAPYQSDPIPQAQRDQLLRQARGWIKANPVRRAG